jgi:citrate synthase
VTASREAEWETSIAEVRVDDILVRGHALTPMVGTRTFVDLIFLVLRGSFPSAQESRMLDAVLVTLIEHGISPSSMIARLLASCGVPLESALAGGALSIGDHHGGSCETVARLLVDIRAQVDKNDGCETVEAVAARIVDDERGNGRTVPGFGHPQHVDGDPRAIVLLQLADKLEVNGPHVMTLGVLGAALGNATGRSHLRTANVTGAIAAILLDLGFPWRSMRGFVISPRTFGLTAHVLEEEASGSRWRHAHAQNVRYTGPTDGSCPR